jgi:glycerol-3-phosphate acyltransferase PlsY
MTTLLVIMFAYLCGSIPTGVIIARRLGIDVRKVGSGNIGATNVARNVGKKAGVFTLLGDAAKGLVPVLIVRALELGETPLACAAVAALLGHLFSPFLHFSGGKGVATGLGVFLGLAPQAIFLALLLFVFTFAVSRIVSFASLVATGATPVLLVMFSYPQENVIAGLIIAGFIILRHQENIVRLLKGQEAQFNMKKPPSSAA